MQLQFSIELSYDGKSFMEWAPMSKIEHINVAFGAWTNDYNHMR